MDYEYDVFVSYKRDFPFGSWVHEHFLPFFSPFLASALNRASVDIFVDTSAISTGDSWPRRLQRALGTSRCLVALWSPLYFNSAWCRRECAAMLRRERLLGFRTVENPAGLMLPICLFDGEHFPETTRSIQYGDCRKYFAVGEGFRKTELYVEFQKWMMAWVDDVARAVQTAPPWDARMLDPTWLADDEINLNPSPIYNFGFPGLG